MSKAKDLIDSTLNTRISPMSYLFVLMGLITGFAFCFLPELSEGVRNSILYKQGALVGVNLWGAILFGGSLIAMVGMAVKATTVTMIGASLGFMAWCFAAIVYAMSGHYYWLLPMAVVSMLSFGYIFLAASLNRLWDYTPSR